MVKMIYGPKGSGKTKKIIEHANNALDVCKGNIVFVTDTLAHSKDVKTAIRYVSTADYGEGWNEQKLVGFVCGVIASNTDVKRIYIDGVYRITGACADDLETLAISLDDLSRNLGFDLYMTVSCEKLPASLKKYI